MLLFFIYLLHPAGFVNIEQALACLCFQWFVKINLIIPQMYLSNVSTAGNSGGTLGTFFGGCAIDFRQNRRRIAGILPADMRAGCPRSKGARMSAGRMPEVQGCSHAGGQDARDPMLRPTI